MPNKNKSYAYRIENAQDEGVAELLEEIDGVYDGTDGSKILYSPNRLGALNQPARQEIRIVEQQSSGRNFINLVNTKLDAVAGFFDTVALAEKFGIKDSANAAAAFVALSGGRVAGGTTSAREDAAETGGKGIEDAGQDEPVLQNAAEGGGEEKK